MAKLLKSVKVYILLGYITLIMIASVTVWLIYDETLDLYDNQIDMNPVSNKIFLANSILTNLYEAEGLERSYLQTGNPEVYNSYNVLIDSISSQIDVLGSIESNPSQTMHTDSIQKLLTKKRENLKELNAIKNSASSEKLYERALLRLTQNKDSLNQIFKIYTSLNSSKDSTYNRQTKARFFERLLTVFSPPEQTDSALQEIVNEKAHVDSIINSFNPTDSVEQIMTSILEEIRRESIAVENQLMQAEQENLENAQIITLQIRQILTKLENEEILFSLRKVTVQQDHISQMKNIVIVLGAAALLVIIGFLIFILKDITRSQHYRQHLEKEKAYSESLLKSKEQLMLSITHDLKSPLNSITGFAHLAAKETSPDHQAMFLKNIEHSANYVLRLIKDLLEFARLETGKLTVEEQSIPIKMLIEEVLNGFFPLAEERKLHLIADLKELPGKYYQTDGARVNQILSNLLSNAIKFTHNGHVKISASVQKSKGKTDWVQITVEDTGIGISEENSQLIFEEFTRVTSVDRHYEGTGLGLPITKRIVELLNGTISLESKYGEGSRFTVILPLKRQSKKSDQQNILTGNPQKVNPSDVFLKERILLVDDDPFLLELTTHLLRESNLTVFPYSNASRALEQIKEQPFEMLITDVQMPNASGFDLLKRFREKYPDHSPALAITGGESNDNEHYLNAGFQAVLQKPFQPEDLIRTVADVLNKKGRLKASGTNGHPVAHIHYSIEGIMAFAEGEIDTFREILTSFANSTSTNLQEFRLYLETKDYEGIKNIAHKMLPMFRQLETMQIIEPLRRLEQGNYGDKEKLLEEGFQVVNNVEQLMEQIIEEHQLPFSGKLIS